MRTPFPLFVACLLLAAAGQAAAQSPAPQSAAPQPPATPAPQPPERKAAGERPLILDLDDASRRQIMRGQSEEVTGRGAAGALPSLGGDTRTPIQSLRSDPYPKTSDQLP